MITVRNLSFGYGRGLVLDDVDAQFDVGVTAIVGANGAGKTTLLRIVAGLLTPRGGTVSFAPFGDRSELGPADVGYLPQGARPTPLLTARSYVEYVAYLRGQARGAVPQQVSDALEQVGMAEHQDTRTSQLSGGMFRRVVLAAALASNPPILLLDEPTSALDPVQRVQLRSLITEIKGDRVVVFATHLLEDVAQVADQVVVLSGTRVVFAGTPTQMARSAGGQVAEAVGQSLESAMIAMIDPES